MLINNHVIQSDLKKVIKSPFIFEFAYYRKHLMAPGDNFPVGILLCTRLGEEMVEYATIGIDENLFISQYLLRLPSREELETWLRRELRMCRK